MALKKSNVNTTRNESDPSAALNQILAPPYSKLRPPTTTPPEYFSRLPPSPPPPPATEASPLRFTTMTTSPPPSLRTLSSSLSIRLSSKSSSSTEHQIRDIHEKQRICIRAFESREAEIYRTQEDTDVIAAAIEKSSTRSVDEKCIEINEMWMEWLQKDVRKLRMEFEHLLAREKELRGEVSQKFTGLT